MKKRVMLSIVVEKYRDSRISDLSKARESSRVFERFFTEELPEESRFTLIQLDLNPSSWDCSSIIDRIVEEYDSETTVLILWTGHGILSSDGSQHLFLCSDADWTVQKGCSQVGAIPDSLVKTKFANFPGDVVEIKDDCRSEPDANRSALGYKVDWVRKQLMNDSRDPRPFRLVDGEKNAGRGGRFQLWACDDGQSTGDDSRFANLFVKTARKRIEQTGGLVMNDSFTQELRANSPWEDLRPTSGKGLPVCLVPVAAPAETPVRLTTEANAALQAGRYEEAERLASEALRIDSSFGWSTHVLTEARKKLEERREKERRSRELDQTLNEGWICHNNGDVKLALAKATAVLKERPNAPAALELKRVAEAAIWSPSPSRAAGYRQTLQIGSQEYGFCWIPTGEFDMGSPSSEKDHYSDEKLHHVKLTKGFWALETPTPQSLYEEVMGTNPSEFKGDDLPVERVSWDEAMEFCAELTKRLPKGLKATLPTEAQWEYMARAGTKTAYWYGDSADHDKMNYDEYVDKTTPVKSYDKNPWGLYNVHGNVWEWQLDYYGDYPSGTATDPTGPTSASDRVFRGGGWDSSARLCRSAVRDGGSADHRGSTLGFRFLLVCD